MPVDPRSAAAFHAKYPAGTAAFRPRRQLRWGCRAPRLRADSRVVQDGHERGGPKAAPLADSAEGVAYFFGLHFWTDWAPLVEPSENRVTAEFTHFLWHRAMT